MKITIHHIVSLEQKLQGNLPGVEAHRIMAPYQRQSATEALQEKKEVRHAATMMLIYPKQDRWFFALMLRPDYDGVHGGQVSFPGGKREEEETPEENALRELEEEIGVDASRIRVLGQLSEVYIPPSNMLVSPFVGMLEVEPMFYPDPKEVERVIEVPLDDLFKEDLIKTKKIVIGKYADNPMTIEVPYFDLCFETVWGATALILSEFKMIFKTQETP